MITIPDYCEITIPDYCEITIRRANGDVETVNYTEATRKANRAIVKTLRPQDFAVMKAAYKTAGQELLSYRNVTKDVQEAKPTAAELKADADYEAYKAAHDAVVNMSAGGERVS